MSVTLPAVPPYFESPKLEYSIIQELQIAFDVGLGWLDLSYHLAKVGIKSEDSKGYPQIFANNSTKEHYDIRPDDKIGAYSFFEIDSPPVIDIENDEITYNLSVVFWCNLDVIDSTLTYDYTSELMKDVTDILKHYEAFNLKTETRPERIFDKYSGIKQELKQFLMKRYSGFKFTFQIKGAYTDGCDPVVIDTVAQNVARINNLPDEVREAVIAELGTLTCDNLSDCAVIADLIDKAAASQSHIANTSNPHNVTKDQIGLSNVDNTSDVDKPVSTAQAAADATAEANAKAYADGLVTGLWDDRGNYNASGNTYPASGGSGSGGTILKGDIWTISVAGTLGGVDVEPGDTVRALIDTPGQVAANWAIAQNNIGYVAENQANKDTDPTLAANSDVKYASQKAVKTYVDNKKQIFTDTSVGLTAGNYLYWNNGAGRKYLYEILSNTNAGETPYTNPEKFFRISPYKYDLILNQAMFPGGTPTCRGLVYLSAAQTGNVPKIYVANNGAGTVSIFNAQTKKLITSIGGVTNPAYGCFVTSRGEVWFGGANVILRINANTDTSPGTIAFVASGELLYHAANDFVYACDFTNNLVRVINAATLLSVTTIASLFNPLSSVYHPIIDRIAVMNNFNGSLYLINPNDNTAISLGLIAGTGSPTYIEYVPHTDNNGNGYFILGNRNTNNRWASLINVVSASSCTFNKAIDVGLHPAKLKYIAAEKWVICGFDIIASGGGDIAIIDVADFTCKRVLQNGAFQNQVRGMVENPDLREIYYSLDSSHLVKSVGI